MRRFRVDLYMGACFLWAFMHQSARHFRSRRTRTASRRAMTTYRGHRARGRAGHAACRAVPCRSRVVQTGSGPLVPSGAPCHASLLGWVSLLVATPRPRAIASRTVPCHPDVPRRWRHRLSPRPSCAHDWRLAYGYGLRHRTPPAAAALPVTHLFLLSCVVRVVLVGPCRQLRSHPGTRASTLPHCSNFQPSTSIDCEISV